MARRHFLLTGLCALAFGCAPQIHAVQEYQANYLCDGSLPLHVIFGLSGAVLDSQGTSVAMTQQAGDRDKFLYRGGGQSLRQQGYDVDWTDGKGAVRHCRRVVDPSPKPAGN